MKSLRKWHFLIFLAAICLSILFFQNCANDSAFRPKTFSNSASSLSAPVPQPHTLPEINYFKEARPAIICGQGGWEFLKRNYVTASCGNCHQQGGSGILPFTDKDQTTSYNSARSISMDSWISTTTKNKFCIPDCDLDTKGEVFQGLMEWVQTTTCPTP